jgi:hypothetical protein
MGSFSVPEPARFLEMNFLYAIRIAVTSKREGDSKFKIFKILFAKIK